MNFSLSMDVHHPDATISAVGELDVFTSQQLRDRILDAVGLGCQRVLLDLSGVTFADGSALRVVSRSHKQLAKDGLSLQLVAWSPQVLRLCQLGGLDEDLHLSDATPA